MTVDPNAVAPAPQLVVKQPVPVQSLWRKSALLYMMTFLVSIAFAGFAIFLVYKARPHDDNTAIVTTIIGFLGAGGPALMALIKGAENAQAIQEVHLTINSRMDEFLRQAAVLGRLQGRDTEREEVAKTVVPPPDVLALATAAIVKAAAESVAAQGGTVVSSENPAPIIEPVTPPV